jgi:translation initiation factor IF-2
MGKVRVYELANKYGKTADQIREALAAGGVKAKSSSSSVDETQAEAILAEKKDPRRRRIAVRRRRSAEPEVAEESTAEVAAEPVAEAPAEVVASADVEAFEPAPTPAVEPVAEPVVEPVVEPVAEVLTAPVVEPVVEAASPEPVAESPVPEAAPALAAAGPVIEAAVEATAETAAEIAPETAETPVAGEAEGADVAPAAPAEVAFTDEGSRPVMAADQEKKPAQVKPVARVVRVIDADAIRQRLQAEGRRGFGGGRSNERPPRPGQGPGGNRLGARPPSRPGAGPPRGPGAPARPGMVVPAAAGPSRPMAPGRRGRPVPSKKKKRRVSKEALLEMQGEELLRRQRDRFAPMPGHGATAAHKRVVKIGESIQVGELAHDMSVKAAEVIRSLFMNGIMVTLTQSIDFDTASLIADEFGFEVQAAQVTDEELLDLIEDTDADLRSRPPVVTVMGHVDHGKTTLLDSIRKANVVTGEAGGITQHIGAYQVQCASGPVTFLDTPGHAAFSAMRARGAQCTDLVVLVVAADDGIKPQTIEAIEHAQEAGVPIIIAMNKMDKPEVKPDQVLQELTTFQLVPEEWGGDTLVCKISALTGDGVPELLENLALQSEMLELKANPSKPASGTVVEAQLDRGRGAVATVLIEAGTLRKGDMLVAGPFYGRVRAMHDDAGNELTEALPSRPVAVLGLNGIPNAGDTVHVTADEKVAKMVADRRRQRIRDGELARGARVNLESFLKHGAPSTERKQLRLVIKGDVQGSVEALRSTLTGLSGPMVEVKVIRSGVGPITENDVQQAVASDAVIFGFNIRPDTKGAEAAAKEQIDLRIYKVIYDVIDDVRAAMEGLLDPVGKEVYLGRAEVRDTFGVPKLGKVAGCYVVSGVLRRNAQVRLLRESKDIYTGELSSLRRFKEDVGEVKNSIECGMGLVGWSDIEIGDVIECFEVEHIRPKLDDVNIEPEPVVQEPEVEASPEV